jgi:hypothetical protein
MPNNLRIATTACTGPEKLGVERGVAVAAEGEAVTLPRTPIPSIPTAIGPPVDSVMMMIEASFCPAVVG